MSRSGTAQFVVSMMRASAVERADDGARGGTLVRRGDVDLVEDDHVGELDLVDQQLDERALVLVARGLAAILQEVVRTNSLASRLAASTTVTMVSSRATSDRLSPSSSRNSKVAATGSGSAMPVDSISR